MADNTKGRARGLAKGALRTGIVEAMRHALGVACEAIGVDPLKVVSRGETVVVDSEGVVVEIKDDGGRAWWVLSEVYQVAEREEGWSSRSDVKGKFEVGDEAVCAKAAAMIVAGHRVDSAIDNMT